MDNDSTIKVSRNGGADPDGYGPGDLYVIIKVSFLVPVSSIYAVFFAGSSFAMILQIATVGQRRPSFPKRRL